ncbi:MAG: hypothetical protein JO020_34340 [Chloroflexi bacterium]|nr:hypothetical protein [Chloroflexota bacterium]
MSVEGAASVARERDQPYPEFEARLGARVLLDDQTPRSAIGMPESDVAC